MSYLYVNEDGVTVGIEANRCVARYKDGMIKYIPIETVEGIVIMGKSQLTTNCMEECLKRGINVSFFSKGWTIFWKTPFDRTCESTTSKTTVLSI